MSENSPIIIAYQPFPPFIDWAARSFPLATFDRFAETLRLARVEATPEALERAVAAATRWAAIDTGAIEGLYEVDRGFTYSVAVGAAAWDTIHALKGESVARAINDAVKAYEYVLDAATHARPVNEFWIKELHATVCASQETYTVLTDLGPQERALPKGVYKVEPNSPLNFATNEVHAYAPPLDTAPEMRRLTQELATQEFFGAHPVVQAAYAHYAYVCIHPFADGNGRVARALASVYLYRNPGIPLVVFADQKPGYLDALEAADDGDPTQFVRFVSERAIDTIGMIREEISSGRYIDVKSQVEDIKQLLTGRGGLEHTEVDALASRLLDSFAAGFNNQLQENPLQRPLRGDSSMITASSSPPEGYRSAADNRKFRVNVSSAAPASAQVVRSYAVAVARPDNDGADFTIIRGKVVVLEVFLRELTPTVSQALEYRIGVVARNELSSVLKDVATAAEKSLRDAGYR